MEIENGTNVDVIVVGAGNAAMCAALSARERGADVLVLERAPIKERGGNTTFTAGGFRFAYNNLYDLIKTMILVLILMSNTMMYNVKQPSILLIPNWQIY